jgi:hypothetical protein
MESLLRHPQKGEAMSIRFVFLVLYLTHALSSGYVVPAPGGGHPGSASNGPTGEVGGGTDPNGLK